MIRAPHQKPACGVLFNVCPESREEQQAIEKRYMPQVQGEVTLLANMSTCLPGNRYIRTSDALAAGWWVGGWVRGWVGRWEGE